MFGDKLKILRKNKGLSQKELGDLFDLGQTTIANYEKNIRFPSPQVLIQIADYFRCSLDELMDREKDDIGLLDEHELHELTSQVIDLVVNEKEDQLRRLFSGMALSLPRLVQLYEQVMMPVMMYIGDLWQKGQISVAKEHYITNMLFSVISGLKVKLYHGNTEGFQIYEKRRAICLSLASEPHTLGLRMIADYFELLGFKAYYLGSNVPTSSLIHMIEEVKPEVLAISATMDYHIDTLINLVQVIRNEERIKSKLDKLKIVVGGQGFKDESQAKEAGADLFAYDYSSLKNGLESIGLLEAD